MGYAGEGAMKGRKGFGLYGPRDHPCPGLTDLRLIGTENNIISRNLRGHDSASCCLKVHLAIEGALTGLTAHPPTCLAEDSTKGERSGVVAAEEKDMISKGN
ncbi:unnamed protein product [Spirodela intermedia]|uniref:Uncharacterized protein n=1 Tax=Spirodela intermedia TaxID=51605 RepID=A0ABN7EBN2_SPIIN|nr:unnamed protein product [Spirodela intermedia]